MIVTFHVALFLAYRIWKNYIVLYLRNDGNEPNDTEALNTDNTLGVIQGSNSPTSPDSETEVNSTNEPNRTSEPKPGLSSSLNSNERNRQMKEGFGDLHPCSYNTDEIKDLKPIDKTFQCHYDEKVIRFIPPAYIQRYLVIEDVLKEPCWAETVKKVVDFGCAELSFEDIFLKKLFTVKEIVAVDVDADKLDCNKCKLVPNAIDYIQKRPSPLTVKIYSGSVGHTNSVLEGANAVIAIELIEHLYPDDLECLPFTVFGFIRPNIAMFTTPNSEFNVLFHDFTGTRHWDHKFEWSREQFEDWGNNLVQRYPEYSVSYRGIGAGPTGSEHLGCLSQMATFVKTCSAPPLDKDEIHIQDGCYKLIQETEFPYYEDKRTQEEILKDEALSFIQKCTMLSQCSNDYLDEDQRKELPLKNVMERTKCLNRKKLKDILLQENFEIVVNKDGYEVIILPDSDDDNESFDNDLPDENLDEPILNVSEVNGCDNTVISDENWDCEWTNECQETADNISVPQMTAETFIGEHNDSSSYFANSDCSVESKENVKSSSLIDISKKVEGSNEIPSNADSTVYSCIDQNISLSDNSTKDMSLENIEIKNVIVVDSLTKDLCSKFSLDSLVDEYSVARSNPTDSIVEDKAGNLDCSVYKTPFHNGYNSSSNCKCIDASAQSIFQEESSLPGDCKKALSFDSPSDYKEIHHGSEVPNSKTDLTKVEDVCSTITSSPLDSSICATPCCSKLHKTFIPKCLSLQQINVNCDSSLFEIQSGRGFPSAVKGDKKEIISKSMDGFKSQESCDIHETCSNTSRVVDSGYPDSYSEHIMDLDLTPEQFDDIGTQSEGEDLSSRSPSPMEPLAPPLPLLRVVDNVENGDVANNNRDGEGNNMVADIEEEFFEFEAQIEEVENEMPNLAVPLANNFEPQNIKNNEDLLGASYSLHSMNDISSDVPDHQTMTKFFSPLNETSNIRNTSTLKESPSVEYFNIIHVNGHTADQKSIKSARSESSIVTKSSWSHLDSSESISDIDVIQGNNVISKQDRGKIKGHNSLTTVLEGFSKFSNCSLVCPIVRNLSTNVTDGDDKTSNSFPQWLLSIDHSAFLAQEEKDDKSSYGSFKTLHFVSSQCHLSSPSLYQSLSSTSVESDGENNDNGFFPKWLLDLQVSETEESDILVEAVNSEVSVWDLENDEDLVGVPYDVQVDARGGGDPQRDSWFD